MLVFDPNRIYDITLGVRPEYREAFEKFNESLLPFGILENANRLSHFLAQGLHESMGLTVLEERLNYSAKRLTQVWPSRFPTYEKAVEYSYNPEKLANLVYGERMGNTQPGDGYKFRGRGFLQISGRFNYHRVGIALGIPLADNPELASDPEWILPVAGAVWYILGGNAAADTGDIRRVTKRINGAYIGLLDRIKWLQSTRRILGLTDMRLA